MINQNLDVYQLNITITRHGPKDGLGGNLTAQGKESVLEYYKNFYHSLKPNQTTNRRLVTSPIHRAKETAYIYKGVIEDFHKLDSVIVEEDDRLSEKDLVEFIQELPDEQKDDWFRYWYYSASGGKVISDFCGWLLEQINKQKKSGGLLQIDAFSHGPIMAGFVLRIEDILGMEILGPVESQEKRLNFARLFTERTSAFNYLGSIGLCVSSDDPESLQLTIRGDMKIIPMSVLEDI